MPTGKAVSDRIREIVILSSTRKGHLKRSQRSIGRDLKLTQSTGQDMIKHYNQTGKIRPSKTPDQ